MFCIDKFIGFMIQKSIESLFNTINSPFIAASFSCKILSDMALNPFPGFDFV